VRYVERNPVRAGLIRRAEEYAWSSAAAHCGLRGDEVLSEMAPPEWLVNLPAAEVHKRWSLWLRDKDDEQVLRRLRMCTRTGRPAGAPDFVDRLERLLGRILRRKKGGRPRKRKKPG